MCDEVQVEADWLLTGGCMHSDASTTSGRQIARTCMIYFVARCDQRCSQGRGDLRIWGAGTCCTAGAEALMFWGEVLREFYNLADNVTYL
jgi:hypothetical protein